MLAQGKNNIFQNEVLASIAEKHHKSIAQVILRWLRQRGIVAIPKSTHKERIIENINIFDFELSQEDINAIAKIDTNRWRMNNEETAVVIGCRYLRLVIKQLYS